MKRRSTLEPIEYCSLLSFQRLTSPDCKQTWASPVPNPSYARQIIDPIQNKFPEQLDIYAVLNKYMHITNGKITSIVGVRGPNPKLQIFAT